STGGRRNAGDARRPGLSGRQGHRRICWSAPREPTLRSKVWWTTRLAGLGGAVDIPNPSLFIGSSSEGLPAAHALQAELEQVCEPRVWSQGVFGPTGTTIGSLLEMTQSSDFAALVLTPDDSVVTRGADVTVARDNVVFELGLFLGTLGPRRVFIIK